MYIVQLEARKQTLSILLKKNIVFNLTQLNE